MREIRGRKISLAEYMKCIENVRYKKTLEAKEDNDKGKIEKAG